MKTAAHSNQTRQNFLTSYRQKFLTNAIFCGVSLDYFCDNSIPFFLISRIIKRDPVVFSFVVAVCAVAATVASFQFSVFTSFLRAGATVPHALGGQVWIVARGVACFDFPTDFGEDYDTALTRYLPNARFRRVAFGFAPYRSPLGGRSNVAVVGVDRSGLSDTAFMADASDITRLDLAGPDTTATVGDTTLHLDRTVGFLKTFLGAPYVVTDFATARHLLAIGSTQTSFIIVDLPNGLPADFEQRRTEAERAFPEVEMLTADEFAEKSSRYWQAKTGAGAAILLAAILAGLLMVVLLINGTLRFLQRYQEDLLSLIGHGGKMSDIRQILFLVAGLVSGTSLALATLLTPLMAIVAYPILPWVTFRLQDMWAPALLALIGVLAATLAADRALAAFPADAVFRN